MVYPWTNSQVNSTSESQAMYQQHTVDLYRCTLICYQFVSNIFVDLNFIHQKKIAILVVAHSYFFLFPLIGAINYSAIILIILLTSN